MESSVEMDSENAGKSDEEIRVEQMHAADCFPSRDDCDSSEGGTRRWLCGSSQPANRPYPGARWVPTGHSPATIWYYDRGCRKVVPGRSVAEIRV